MTRITITIPTRVPPVILGRLTNWLESSVQEVVGTCCDITVEEGERERRETIREMVDELGRTGDLTRGEER